MCGSRAKYKTAEEVKPEDSATGVDESQATGLVTVQVEHLHGSIASLVIILAFLFVAWLVWRYLRGSGATSAIPSPDSVRIDAGGYDRRMTVPTVSYVVDREGGGGAHRSGPVPSIQWSPTWQPASFNAD